MQLTLYLCTCTLILSLSFPTQQMCLYNMNKLFVKIMFQGHALLLHLQPHTAEICFAGTLLLQDFDSSMECDGGLGDDVLVSYETPLFQGVLMSYLDDKAPVIGETPSRLGRTKAWFGFIYSFISSYFCFRNSARLQLLMIRSQQALIRLFHQERPTFKLY